MQQPAYHHQPQPPMVPELAALKLGAGSSILTACELLRAQWPFTQHMPGMPPIFLLHQIYFLLDDRTSVDRELSALQQANQVRVFKLFAREGHDLCLVLTDDYVASIYDMLPEGAITPPTDDEPAAAVLAPAPTTNTTTTVERPRAVNLARPATLPAAGSSAMAAASTAAVAAAPVKAQSAVTPRFAAWPSSGKSTFAAIAMAPSSASSGIAFSTATTAPPSREPSTLNESRPLRAVPSMAAAAAGDGFAPPLPAAASKPPIKRKRSQPLPAPTIMATPSSAAAAAIPPRTARAASVDSKAAPPLHQSGDITPSPAKKQKLAAPVVASAAAATSAAPNSISLFDDDAPRVAPPSKAGGGVGGGGDVFQANPATGGQNPKLHVSLNDYAEDDRFPGAALAPAVGGAHFSPRDAGILLGAFLANLVPHYTDISITEERLMALLDQPRVSRRTSLTRERIVSCLLHLGLLLFKTATSFFFAPPSSARLIGCVRAGRKELVAILKRHQYREMPLREMLQKPNLKTSPCRIEFHLREMIGSGEMIEMTDTTIGPLIKLVKK